MSWALPVAAAISAVGSFTQSMSQASAASAAARQARQDAALAEAAQRRKSAKLLGTARTRFLASGVTLDGSPQDALDDIAQDAELDALTLRYRGEVQAGRLEAEARMRRFGGGTALAADTLRVGHSLWGPRPR